MSAFRQKWGRLIWEVLLQKIVEDAGNELQDMLALR